MLGMRNSISLVYLLLVSPLAVKSGNVCNVPLQNALNATADLPAYVVDCRANNFREKYKILSAEFDPVLLVDDSTLSTPEMRRFINETGAKLVCKLGTPPNTIEPFLQRKVQSLKVITLLPSDARGIAKLYGVDENLAQAGLAQMQKTVDQFATIFGSAVSSRHQAVSDASSLEKILKSEHDETVIIVGHNNGTDLKFPDGSTLKLTKVNDLLTSQPGKGVLLSCDTLESAQTNQEGTFSAHILQWYEISRACREAVNAQQTDRDMSFLSLLHTLETGLQAPDKERKQSLTLMARACGGGLIVGTVIALPASTGEDSGDRK
jgi:hypothetical protein